MRQDMGAALSYYTVFSLAPMLLIVIAVAGLVFGQDAARGALLEQLSGLMGADAAKAVQDLLASASGDRRWPAARREKARAQSSTRNRTSSLQGRASPLTSSRPSSALSSRRTRGALPCSMSDIAAARSKQIRAASAKARDSNPATASSTRSA